MIGTGTNSSRSRNSSTRSGGPAATGLLRARRWWYLVAAALVLALLVWLIAFSSVLGVRSVSVVGARTLTAAEVRAVAAIRAGTPLARLDTDAVSRRVRGLAPFCPDAARAAAPAAGIRHRRAVGGCCPGRRRAAGQAGRQGEFDRRCYAGVGDPHPQ
jgi:hypothetical protein